MVSILRYSSFRLCPMLDRMPSHHALTTLAPEWCVCVCVWHSTATVRPTSSYTFSSLCALSIVLFMRHKKNMGIIGGFNHVCPIRPVYIYIYIGGSLCICFRGFLYGGGVHHQNHVFLHFFTPVIKFHPFCYRLFPIFSDYFRFQFCSKKQKKQKMY